MVYASFEMVVFKSNISVQRLMPWWIKLAEKKKKKAYPIDTYTASLFIIPLTFISVSKLVKGSNNLKIDVIVLEIPGGGGG